LFHGFLPQAENANISWYSLCYCDVQVLDYKIELKDDCYGKFVEGSSHGLVKASHVPEGTEEIHGNSQGSQHHIQDMN
jgi:hypothetical protein